MVDHETRSANQVLNVLFKETFALGVNGLSWVGHHWALNSLIRVDASPSYIESLCSSQHARGLIKNLHAIDCLHGH